MEYTLKIQTRFPDYDTQKFVNHSKICTYVELTYLTFLRECINAAWDFGVLPIVLKKEETEYFIPITPISKPVCKLWVSQIRPSSFTVDIQIYEDNDPVVIYATGKRILVHIDLNKRKAKKIDKAILERFNNYFRISHV